MIKSIFQIMVIDDDDREIELLEALLNNRLKNPFNLSKWNDCMEALEYLEHNPIENSPRMIFVDWMMPKMNGNMVIKQIKGKKLDHDVPLIIYSNIPQIVYSSYDRTKNSLNNSSDGKTYFFKKPLEVDKFTAFLKDHFPEELNHNS